MNYNEINMNTPTTGMINAGMYMADWKNGKTYFFPT